MGTNEEDGKASDSKSKEKHVSGTQEKPPAIVVQNTTTPSIKVPTELNWSGNMAENWSFFKQKFDIYMIASKSSSETSQYQIALLLSVIGDRALKIYNNFTYTDNEDKNDIKTTLAKLDNYFIPDKNITYERHVFFLREQRDESIDSYVTDLRDLSSSCDFGSLTDSLIKDKLILGIKDRVLKDRLLRIKDLTLNQALDVCRSAETTSRQLQDISSDETGCSDVNKISKSRYSDSTNQGQRRSMTS